MCVTSIRNILFFRTMEKIHCSECGKLMVSVAEPPYCPTCLTKENPIPEKSGAPWPLAGRRFIVKADGVRSLNGKLAGHTFFGNIQACPPDMTVWDVMRAIIDNAEEEYSKVEHIYWLSVELMPAKSTDKTQPTT